MPNASTLRDSILSGAERVSGDARSGLLGNALALVVVLVTLLALDSMRTFGDPILGALVTLETHYYYGLMALLLPFVYLRYPSTQRWFVAVDLLLALLAFGVAIFMFVSAETMLDEGWEFEAPRAATWCAYALWLLVLEAVRRAGGYTLFALVLVFSLYPLVADRMPEAISGMAATFDQTAAYHTMSSESLLGLPFRAFANLVIGFLVFGVALQRTGGGQFFINLSMALLGSVRGGAAKVAIVSSGLMGSMSGSVITNVLTTGQLTIPAMQRSGIGKETAAGIEACASTGGVLLPPIMGSTAFVMATFLQVPYYEVAVAAAIPALLYFAALFLQIDSYAGRNQLSGLTAGQIPSLGSTLRDGWYYLGAFAVLVILLLVLHREALAPWIATGVLLILNQFSSAHRWRLWDSVRFCESVGALLVELLAILADVGLIVGALSLTGLSGTLVNELLFLAGGSTLIPLLMGALTSFVLGIGMTVTAAYIFLAIILAPALIEGGLDPLAVHLFILYWGMSSFITPPVALGAFAGAAIAGARPMLTGFTAMGLGASTYFIPFVFVLAPELTLQDGLVPLLLPLAEALLGVLLIAAAVQGYLLGFGALTRLPLLTRPLLGAAGVMIALPGFSAEGLFSNVATASIALVVAVGAAVVGRARAK